MNLFPQWQTQCPALVPGCIYYVVFPHLWLYHGQILKQTIPAISSKTALTYEVLMQGFHKWVHFPSWDKVFARCSDIKRTQLFAKAGQTQDLQSLGASPVPSTCTSGVCGPFELLPRGASFPSLRALRGACLSGPLPSGRPSDPTAAWAFPGKP